jgi:hypothetical protein
MFYENKPTSEPLFQLAFEFSKLFTYHYFFFLLMGLISLIPILLISFKRSSIWIFFIYLTLPAFYIESFSIVRQSCALSICIYAYHLYDKKNIHWISAVILAICFHVSAIIFLLFLGYLSKSGKWLKIIMVLTLVIICLFNQQVLAIVSNYYPKLTFYDGSNQYGGKQVLFNLLVYALCYQFLNSRDGRILVAVGVLISIPLLSIDAVFLRLMSYFLIPLLFVSGFKNNVTLKINEFALVVLLILGFFFMLYVRSYTPTGQMFPYNSIL